MRRSGVFAVLGAAAVALVASRGEASEVHIGNPVVKNGLVIAPNYLTDIQMDGMPAGMQMGKDTIHLELDVHAGKNETHHLREGTWIPYLTIRYTLTKAGSSFRNSGVLQPMIAAPGLHYANGVKIDGPGAYHLTYSISAPAIYRHADKGTGVPPWWKPFTLDWNFRYPARGK